MKFSRSIHAVDSHTAGEATRVVIGGIPNIPGKSMLKRRNTWKNTSTICVRL